MSRVTLAQWQMLAAVVDHGGFARAAEAIHKSPSTLNHAVHKLEEQLGIQVLEPVGRQAASPCAPIDRECGVTGRCSVAACGGFRG